MHEHLSTFNEVVGLKELNPQGKTLKLTTLLSPPSLQHPRGGGDEERGKTPDNPE
jgi:hypothetical protein